jgi:hypothetical protein
LCSVLTKPAAWCALILAAMPEPYALSEKADTRVVWTSFVSACLAWTFDAMDLTIFTLVSVSSVSELIGSTDTAVVAATVGVIVGAKLLAWGVAGIVFGVVADLIGRARTMMITVLIYSVFTGLSALAQTWWQLLLLQAAAAIGIGGEWAAGAALVAETWPKRTRHRALVAMQMCFAGGFFVAGALSVLVGPSGWRHVFAAGALPAVMTLGLRWFVTEPAALAREPAGVLAGHGGGRGGDGHTDARGDPDSRPTSTHRRRRDDRRGDDGRRVGYHHADPGLDPAARGAGRACGRHRRHRQGVHAREPRRGVRLRVCRVAR